MGIFLTPSLSGGELAPGLRGRVDMARYAISLGLARNFITKNTGGGAKRPGQYFRGRVKYGDRFTRLIPFVYSTEVKYMVEAGDLYFRFWVGGQLLTDSTKAITNISNGNPAVVTSNAHGFVNGQFVLVQGVAGMDRLNDRSYQIAGVTPNTFQLVGTNSTGYTPYAGGGTVSRVVEVATPYTQAMLPLVRLTQSADVLYLAHGQVPTKELRRTTATSFELVNFDFRRGPFRSFNSDEAAIMAVSGTSGTVQVTTNVPVFDPAMVGSVNYIEEKELRSVKPWASAEKNVPVGALRRSDFKVYRAVSIPTSLGGVGTPYYITGATRPTHTSGRAFDGPQDIKSDGVNSYAVGVEWEFAYNTFGIFQITSYVSPTQVIAQVIERIPDSIIGTAPAPAAGPFLFVGDGVTTTFATPGITSSSPVDYVVTLNGAPVQSNPSYPGGGGVGGTGGGNPRPGSGHIGTVLE